MKLLGYVALLIVLFVFGYSIYVLAPRLGEWQPQKVEGGVEMTMESVSEYTDTYSIQASYPQFGLPAVDAAVKEVIDSAIANFKTYPANPPESAAPQNEFMSTVSSTYIGSDVVSVELIISEYTGGAHPNAAVISVNIDRASGKNVTLDEALAMTGKTLQEVADHSLMELKTRLGDDMLFAEGAAPTPENYSTFLIDADSVTFVFQNYQVASYAAGPQKVEIGRK